MRKARRPDHIAAAAVMAPVAYAHGGPTMKETITPGIAVQVTA
jgi:hypothetical protein